jgi:hypothetical protein
MTTLSRFPARLPELCVAVLVAAIVALLGAVLPSTSASALGSIGHGEGHLSASTGMWLGSYRLADGRLAFCLEAGKQAPTGHDYSFSPHRGLYTPDDAARLAYISRTWGASTSPDLAAAGQLATWTIAGLNGQSQDHYASRAGSSAPSVMAATRQVLAAADSPGGASRSVSARVSLIPGADGKLTASTELSVDFLAGGSTVLAAGSHSGSLSLTGGVFDDGSTTRTVTNGENLTVTATGSSATVAVTASASFEGLPYGQQFEVGFAGSDVQAILLAGSATAEGTASSTVTVPSSLPFQPMVVTQTSDATATVGASISDELILSAVSDAGPDVLPEWGVYTQASTAEGGSIGSEALLPIPVTVESSLLGPFAEAIVPAEASPAGAPVVCVVEVTVVDGPGTYRTPECTLPSPGYYVWVERIVPERTAPEQGGARILPWQSAFGTASVAPPTPSPIARPVSASMRGAAGTVSAAGAGV